MLCKCYWIVLYIVHVTAFCLGGGVFSGHGVYFSIRSKPSPPLSGPHKCNTTTIQLQYKNFFLYCSCIVLVRAAQLQYNNFLCYFIVVVL